MEDRYTRDEVRDALLHGSFGADCEVGQSPVFHVRLEDLIANLYNQHPEDSTSALLGDAQEI